MNDTPKDHHDWTGAYRQYFASGTKLNVPCETVVRLFKGNYVPGLPKSYTGMKALDVGFGSGNNLMFLASLGMEVAGTEVTEGICDLVHPVLRHNGMQADLRVGTNSALPFDDNSFDFLLSWNVLHYEGDEAKVAKGISEYARVLKPGGRLFLSTAAPDHKIMESATVLGGHRYRIGRADDFRKGAVYFYFDSERYLQFYFGRSFDEVMTGRLTDRLFTDTLDLFLVTGVARK
jgi:ubiquinone/menaquinone biosynthesis C-methylase UbiE